MLGANPFQLGTEAVTVRDSEFNYGLRFFGGGNLIHASIRGIGGVLSSVILNGNE